MTWIYLVIAGIFEVVWSTTMKLSQGFTKIGWAIATIIVMIASFAGLIIATKHLPLESRIQFGQKLELLDQY